MKRLKKIIIATFVTLGVLILISLMFMNDIVYAITGSKTIKNINGTSVTLGTGTQVSLGERVVYQSNVLCVQHGKDLVSGSKYTATQEYTVSDPVLEYILTHGSALGQAGFWKSDTQVALWRYLYQNRRNYKKADINNILGAAGSRITIENIILDGHVYKIDYNKGIELYNDALSYKNTVDSVSATISNKKVNGNKITFTVSGEYDYFEVYLDNVKKETHNTSATQTITLSTTKPTASLKVKAYIRTKTVKYRVLKNSGSQRLIVVTSTSDSTKSKETTTVVTLDADVSLQKYITKVNGKNLSNSDTAMTSRENQRTYANEKNTYVRTKIYYDKANNKAINAGANYKYEKPVMIEKNDTVTYRINVYNNLSVTAKNIKVRDRLPFYEDTNGTLKSYAKIVEAKQGSTTISLKTTTTDDDMYYEYTIPSLGANKSTYLLITVKYEELDEEEPILTNTAWIYSVDGGNLKNYRTVDRDYVIFKTDVSLQKYIVKVEDTSISGRDNQRTATNESNSNVKDKISTIVNKVKNADTSKYKRNNPVEIENNSLVTYKIEVYNNSNVKAENIKIKDTLPVNASLESITVGTNTDDIKDEWTISNRDLTYEFDLRAQKSTYFLITVKVSGATKDNIYTNTASIQSVRGTNKSTCRTVDRDYFIIKEYAVSLKKFVTKVNDTDINGRNEGTNGNRYNENLRDGDPNKDPWKLNNKVPVEPGDTVTFTIRLKNKSNSPVQITKISDSYTNLTSGLKLEYDTSYGIRGNGGGTLDTSTDIITFNNPTLLNNNGNYVDVTIRFKVTVPTNLTNTSQILNNKAGINEIKNKHDVRVSDSDGTDNNYDMDWVQTKTYAVSLEKYVTQVTDKNGGNVVTYNAGSGEYQDRSGKRFNDMLNSNILGSYDEKYKREQDGTNHNTYKLKNPAKVEPGDYVTYTIRLGNTGTTPVKITKIYDSFRFISNDKNPYNGLKLEYDINYGIKDASGNKIANVNVLNQSDSSQKFGYNNTNEANMLDRMSIDFGNNMNLSAGEVKDVTIRFKVTVPYNLTNSEQTDPMDEKLCFYNKAGIVELKNKNDIVVADGKDNNYDMDFIQTKTYKVSLQKIVSSVNGGSTGSSFNRWNSWESNEINDKQKYNNPVEVAKGDTVTYAIKVRNDGSTQVKNFAIQDTLPTSGIDTSTFRLERVEKYNSSGGKMTNDIGTTINGTKLTLTGVLNSQESVIAYVSVTVTESNMSLNVLRNYAEITGTIQNRNDVDVKDSTPNDNQDADYIQMKDIAISGTVWNDKALNKTQDNYNGKYDDPQEDKLGDIKVYLYRNGTSTPIATTYTNNDSSNMDTYGTYSFLLNYIKGPKVSSTINRWAGTYYSYYVVFEYDGITYTSTTFADVTSNNSLDSNAKEDVAKVKESRTAFNNRFSTINNASGITYTTKNEDGYIPQSNHVYNASTMAMQSSTNLISLSNDDNLVSQLQHVNLGLRGRDIFDLELTSGVDNVKVTVNGQQGVYQYSNKVNLRKSDLTPSSTTTEDMANKENESSNTYVDRKEQLLRKADIYNDKYAVNGTKGDTGLGIEVTYKITITNASRTDGTATKVTNYYDSKYEFKRVYPGENCNEIISAENGTSGSGYNSKIITVRGKTLGQSETMGIYVVYRLKDAATTLSVLLGNGEKRLPTYNMAEVTEYKTQCASGQTEYTRGLLDKDSAPGSANKEQVRTTETVGQNTKTTGGNPTTVQYYFGGNDLSKLKYEDDTYATPTLYFVSSDNSRTISGIAFEDYTSINSDRVKSGNGIKDSTEPTIKGITVKLIEGDTVRDTTTTDENGYYQFKDFLPGNYTIKYYYGDTDVTFLKTSPNIESYNGEDFQATNNSYDVSGINVHKLSTRSNYWYLDNESEGVSTGTDDTSRRRVVSEYFLGENSDEKIQVLNNAKAGNKIDVGTIGADDVKGNSYMYANTKSMTFTLEKSEINDTDDVIQRNQFGNYTISNMNFGIAEVPITRIDLQKHVKSFAIKDSTGNNTIASALKDDAGNWELQGDVIAPEGTNTLDVSIEDEKLQGARLQVTYAITSQINAEKNFDGKELAYATITELVDYIDNNLSYNSSLGKNSDYWEITDRNSIFEDPNVQGTVDPEGKLYTTIVKAKAGNPILNSNVGTATITLEKVLSSTDSTFEDILASKVEAYTYKNTLEITGINYGDTTSEETDPTPGDTDPSTPRKDLVRTPDRYIIIPKKQNDSTRSEVITIHPPTGDSNINILYYVIATVSLVILAIGAFGIKKFVVKKNKE